MKIGSIESKPVAASASTERKASATSASSSSSSTEASAQVALSPAASLLSGISTDPTFDSAKVDRIAQAISKGEFKVNADAIADKLITNAEELLGRKFS